MELILSETPEADDPAYIEDQLLKFNAARVDGYAYEQFVYKMVDESESMIAGINCEAGGGWLYIAGLW